MIGPILLGIIFLALFASIWFAKGPEMAAEFLEAGLLGLIVGAVWLIALIANGEML